MEGINLRQLPVSQLDQLRILLRSDLDKLNDVSIHILSVCICVCYYCIISQ